MDNNTEILFEQVTSSMKLLIEYLGDKVSDNKNEEKLYSDALSGVSEAMANIEKAFESLNWTE